MLQLKVPCTVRRRGAAVHCGAASLCNFPHKRLSKEKCFISIYKGT